MRGHLENKTGCCHDHHEAMLVVSEHMVFDNSAAHQDIRQVYFMQQIFEYTCGHIDVSHTYVPLCVEVPDPPVLLHLSHALHGTGGGGLFSRCLKFFS